MDTTTHFAVEPCTQTRTGPCTRACMVATTEKSVQATGDSCLELPSRPGRCARGFSRLQIAVLSVLKAHQQVIAYWQIAELISSRYGIPASEGAVRGALERMYRRDFLMRHRAASGSLKGNRYAFATDPCPHIVPCPPGIESGTDSAMRSIMREGPNSRPSILEEKDRKSLSFSSGAGGKSNSLHLLDALTEEDIAFHWPTLAKSGFGTDQIRQIIARLAQVNGNIERIMQGLTHAEWELAENRMCDKTGNSVASPASWVFKILATQGYYPRPEGYRSPQEWAEQDAEEELKRRTAAYESRQAAEADAWIARLSLEERSAILGPQSGTLRIPDEVILRRHFRSAVWPTMQGQDGT